MLSSWRVSSTMIFSIWRIRVSGDIGRLRFGIASSVAIHFSAGLPRRLQLHAQRFLEAIMVGSEFAQIDLVTPRDMLEQILDAQLQLRLAHLFLPARIVQFVQRIAHRAQVRFETVHGGQTAGAFLRNRSRPFLPRAPTAAACDCNRSLRLLRFDGLRFEPTLVVRNVRATRIDQFAQFGCARRHRLTLTDQTFLALLFGRDREPQTLQ